MTDDLTATADARLESALEATGGRDPREFYRDRLRELKQADPDGYGRAVEYYKSVLIPTVADEGSDPIAEWTEYGRRLASSLAPGRTVSVDPTGFARPFETHTGDGLILHLPQQGGRALLVGLPSELSPAQRATYDVLVSGKQRPSG